MIGAPTLLFPVFGSYAPVLTRMPEECTLHCFSLSTVLGHLGLGMDDINYYYIYIYNLKGKFYKQNLFTLNPLQKLVHIGVSYKHSNCVCN